MTRLRSAIAVPLAALLAAAPVLAGPALAAAAKGSVPSEVAAYVAEGSLVAQLAEVYGPGPGGTGIDFDETTTTGRIERVHVWSPAFLAGEDTDHPIDIVNEWVVPVSIAEAPVGLATIWINPATVLPELASFAIDAELATALAEVPEGAALVHDATSAAWLALAPDGTVTPLVPGSTGLSTPVPLDDIAILPPAPAEPAGGDPGTGVGLAIAVVIVLLAVIVVALVLPGFRREEEQDAEEQDADGEQEDAGEEQDAGEEPAARD